MIISFSKNFVVPYVPPFGSNRDDPKKCIFGLKHLTSEKQEDFVRTLALIRADNVDKPMEQLKEEQKAQKKLFVDNCDYVKNYIMDDKEQKDVAEVYDNMSEPLKYTIFSAMKNSSLLNLGQLKNFEGGSDTNTSKESGGPPSSAKPVPSKTKTSATAKTKKS